MKRSNNINTTVAVALMGVMALGCGVAAQAATVGYWRFEGDGGTAVTDGSSVPTSGTPVRDEINGSHLVGTVNGGVIWEGDDAGDLFGPAVSNPDPLDTSTNGTLNANGVNTRSLRFDATTPSDAYVIVDDTNTLDMTGAFTVEGFFRVDRPAKNNQLIFLNKRQIGGPGGGPGYKAWMDSYGRVGFLVDNGPTTGRVGWDDIDNNHNANLLDDGQWHHFAGVRDDNNDLHIYIDGVEDIEPWTNGITNLGGDLSNDEPLLFGEDGPGVGGLLGYIDEIRISDVALTPDQFLNASVSLGGDYNGDGVVDAADYTVWQDHLGDTGAPGAVLGDGTSDDLLGTPDGDVDQFDYAFWKQKFGNSGTGASNSLAIPEPATLAMVAWSLLAIAVRRGS